MQGNNTVPTNISMAESFNLHWDSLYPNMSNYVTLDAVPNITAFRQANTTDFYFHVSMPNMT